MVIERQISGFSGWGGEAPPPQFSRQTLMIGGAILGLHLAGAVYLYSMRAASTPAEPRDPPGIQIETWRQPKIEPKPKPETVRPKVETPHPSIPHPEIHNADPLPLKPMDTQQTKVEGPPVISDAPKSEPKVAPTGPKTIRNPTWLARPTAEQLNRYYPAGPLDEGLAGEATLDCTVTARGELTACGVFGERPRGRGFGDAALKLSRIFRMSPKTEDGQPVEGGTIKIPIRFTVTE